jgi:hypothetical protein
LGGGKCLREAGGLLQPPSCESIKKWLENEIVSGKIRGANMQNQKNRVITVGDAAAEQKKKSKDSILMSIRKMCEKDPGGNISGDKIMVDIGGRKTTAIIVREENLFDILNKEDEHAAIARLNYLYEELKIKNFLGDENRRAYFINRTSKNFKGSENLSPCSYVLIVEPLGGKDAKGAR